MTDGVGANADGPQAAPPQSPLYIGVLIGLLMLVAIISNIDRSLLGILAEPIKRDLNLSDSQFGLLAGLIFAAFYTGFGLPLAHLAEKTWRHVVLGVCVAVWSVATALSGAANTFLQMALTRIGVASGESCTIAISHSLIGDYVPVRWRSRAISCIGAGSSIGTSLGMLLGGLVAAYFSWRWTFVIIGLPGVLVALAVLVFLRDPRRAVGAVQQIGQPLATTVRKLLGNPVYLILVGAAVCCTMGSVGVQVWSAPFVMRRFDASIASAGTLLGVSHGITGTFGMLMGGVLAVRAAEGRGGVRLPAFIVMSGGLCYALAFLAPTLLSSMVLMTVGKALTNVWYAAVFTSLQRVAGPAERGQAVAVLYIFNAVLGIGLGPSLIGFLSDALPTAPGMISLQVPLVLMGVIVAIGGAALLVSARFLAASAAPR